MNNDNLSSNQKKGNGSKPEALWLEKTQMNKLCELYEKLSRHYNFSDKPYSDVVNLAIQFHWHVIMQPEMRCFKLDTEWAVDRIKPENYEYSSVQIGKACYVCLNDLCKLYSQADNPCSRRFACMLSLRFLEWYLEGGRPSMDSSIFISKAVSDRENRLHTLNSRFDSWVNGLLPYKELSIEEVDEDE